MQDTHRAGPTTTKIQAERLGFDFRDPQTGTLYRYTGMENRLAYHMPYGLPHVRRFFQAEHDDAEYPYAGRAYAPSGALLVSVRAKRNTDAMLKLSTRMIFLRDAALILTEDD